MHAPIRVELAPTLDCSQDSLDFPSDLRFFELEICPSAGGDCVMLTDPGGDHAPGTPLLRIARALDGRFSVDARVDGSVDYDVFVTGYSGAATGTCTPTALGHALGVRFGQGTVDVRLYPVGGWNCAGPHEGQSMPVTRALHQAVLLPNHEVLLLGGIMGPRAGAVAFATPSTFPQTIVEVFDPRDGRFHQVTMNDESGNPGFSRVMFEARYVSTNADGQYEIHTYGGFDLTQAPEGGVGFDGNANTTSVSALFGPLSMMMMGAGAGFRTDAVILYDPDTRTATIAPHMAGNYTTTAATEGPTNIGVVRSIDTVTVSGTGRPAYQLSAGWYVDGGRQDTLLAGRLGSSITTLSMTNYLVWGGHVANSMDMVLTAPEVIADAGEIVSGMSGSSMAVAAHDSTATPDDNRPYPTAYHTATHIAGMPGSTAILFAGGALLGAGSAPLGATCFVGDTTATSCAGTAPLTVARFSAAGAFVSGTRVMGRVPTVLHTATPVDASATDIVLVGGASQMPLSGVTTTLFGVKTAGVVHFDAATGYTWHALPDLVSGRWGHTTTVIPNHGVLVVGGISRADATLTVSDSSEFLLWEDLRGTGLPMPMDCAMPTDAGVLMDAGRTDGGVVPDTGARDMGTAPDTGPAVDANVDANRPDANLPDTSVDSGARDVGHD